MGHAVLYCIHYRYNPEALATHSVSVIILSMLLVVIGSRSVGLSDLMMLVSRYVGLHDVRDLGNHLSLYLSYIR